MTLLVFLGESGSGKTTLINELTDRYSYHFKKIVTCTSRRKRSGEVDGADYHFHSADYFVDNPDLVLVKQTSDGNHYATRKVDLHSDTHTLLVTLRPGGIRKLLDLGLENFVVGYISITEELKTVRMRHRGDSEKMIKARLLSDVSERSKINWNGIPIINLEASDSIEVNVQKILREHSHR
jgi:guanylate kinase